MRDWSEHEKYLNKLAGDIYAQPSGKDEHGGLAKKAIDLWMSRLTGCTSVLDLGCGEGFCQPFFEAWNLEYEGICLGQDFLAAKEQGRNVRKMDFSFLEYGDNTWDLLFARHSWEHAVMPLLTLMEWGRVSKQWLGLILPHPDFYTVRGKNHYNVLYHDQIMWLLEVAGWNVIWDEIDYKVTDPHHPETSIPHEFWVFSEKARK